MQYTVGRQQYYGRAKAGFEARLSLVQHEQHGLRRDDGIVLRVDLVRAHLHRMTCFHIVVHALEAGFRIGHLGSKVAVDVNLIPPPVYKNTG